ncbi:MAG: hypothetical protein FKY71_07765 [Spiribacter salinus]|uniref:Uncharacterized protein n=1 Tax=Spiribacter salinus TaxID=1335746 RepID=A0A540VSF1_9GAMM|nr:MAG: hypothetical protein FKY71_07765 [Spiribacter salinus]
MQWKNDRIRSALKYFKELAANGYDPVAEALGERTSYSWRDLATEIAAASDVELSERDTKLFAERLRQFVEGSPDKAKKRAQTGQPGRDVRADLTGWRLELVEKFLASADPDHPARAKPLLSPEYLSEPGLEVQAPAYLAETLARQPAAKCYLTDAVASGIYIAEDRSAAAPVTYRMDLKVHDSPGPAHIHVTEDYAPPAAEDGGASAHEPPGTAPVPYFGWAVLTPEDTILAFLKNARTKENHIFCSVTVDARAYDGEPMQCVSFFHHNLPVEIECDPENPDEPDIAELLPNPFLTFWRQSP